MPLSRLALILILLTLSTELGIGLWRHADPPPSKADVFSFPTAATAFNQSEAFATVVSIYGADRGAECKLAAEDGTTLTAFYFEWDKVEAAPMMNLAGHAPERCNVAIGYKLLGIDAPRTYQPAGQLPLSFDCTRFEDRSGRKMYVFKVAWIQGLGTKSLRIGTQRWQRLKDSFVRHIGAARVLEAGVFGARDMDHAWSVFQEQVLDHLSWQPGGA